MRFGDGAGWAGHKTALTTAAARLLGRVSRQLERGQDFSKEEPGPEFWVDQHCALAVPAHARFSSVIALEDGPRVDIAFLDATSLGEERAEFLELPQHQLMIIVAPCVT